MSVEEALREQSLNAMWEHYQEMCIPPERSVEQVSRQREAFMAGAIGVLVVERSMRGRLNVADRNLVFNRLRGEGEIFSNSMVEYRLNEAAKTRETQ